ncbi:MAG: Cys-Cys-COOH (seleno)protein SaoC [Enterocloster bolteae]
MRLPPCLFRQQISSEAGRGKNSGRRRLAFAPAVEKDNEALLAFKKEFPDREIYLACQEDVTDDGISDLLVIYKEGSLVRFVTAMGQDGGGYVYTDPIPAPIENQGIQFKNIDHEGEMEFIISGEKNGQAGYAIYRIIDGQPKDLFGDGMDNCC